MSTNHSLNQWLDLGIHTEACMTIPETCCEGGAISFWINIRSCSHNFTNTGLITTQVNTNSTGSLLVCTRFGSLG